MTLLAHDKNLILRRFRRGWNSYPAAAVVQQEMAEQLITLLTQISPADSVYSRVLEIGCGAGALSAQLAKHAPIEHIVLNDLLPEAAASLRYFAPGQADFLPGDIETVALPENLTLVAANASLQWVTDLDALLTRLADRMTSDGVLLFSSFEPGHFYEIEQAAGRAGLPWQTPEQWRLRLAQCRFQLLAQQAFTRVLHFPNVEAVLAHIRATGVGALPVALPTRGAVTNFTQAYEHLCAAEMAEHGTVTLTYKPLLLAARRV